MKTALITGITGQDGSYLAEFLLKQDYRVIGMVRRTSTVNFDRIRGIQDDIVLAQGDLLDQMSLVDILNEFRPDEVYNLAAQSFVPTSWKQPVLTGEFTALGVTRMLEAIRIVNPQIRFYQASSSEMFGKVQEVPQNEKTPFYPRSPYGVAKVYGHWITVNYRESYNLFAVSGILFNHECIAANTPLIVRKNGIVNVMMPDELVPLRQKGRSVQTFEVPGLEVWDGEQWTPVLTVTATARRTGDPQHRMLSIQARAGVVEVTVHHHMLNAQHEVVPAKAIAEGEQLALGRSFPEPPGWTVVTPELAEFLGLMTAEGYVPKRGTIHFTNNDPDLRVRVAELWHRLFLGSATTWFAPSGWNTDQTVGHLNLNGGSAICEWLRNQLYAPDGHKRVPALILNSQPDVQRAYLEGYYAGDGLKAGNGDSVKTNSAVLAQGLCWLYASLGRRCSVYVEYRDGRPYYTLNLFSDHVLGEKGQHLHRDPSEVRRSIPAPAPTPWVFDLETGSGRFCAGVGRILVHNSPRRGLEFVTHKVTYQAAKIRVGMADKLLLGNLDSKRDWGYAPDYVRAMWMMLQQPEPDDYVVATGETHSVRELCLEAFGYLGLNWEDHVIVDPALIRPAEVDHLVGDASKAGRILGWEPTVSFRELIERMVEADLEALRNERQV